METATAVASTSAYCRSRPTKSKTELLLPKQQRYTNLSSSASAHLSPILERPHIQTKRQLLDHVLADLQSSRDRGVKVDSQIFSSLLETCFKMQAFEHAFQIHHLIPPQLLRKSADLSSKLLRLYASCGLLREAHQLFDQMPRHKSVFAWNSLISGYTDHGFHEDAMALYYQMEEEGIEPDNFTFPRVLKACAGIGLIQRGEAVHRHVIRTGFGTDHFVLNALVDMYAKCGDIVKSRQVFDKIPQRDLVSWNSMLTAYICHDLFAEALDVLRQMLNSGLKPDSVSVSCLLPSLFSRRQGIEIHGWVLRQGLEQNLSVANSLIDMYSNCGRLDHARLVFETMPEKDVVSWNTIISSYQKDVQALTIFQRMQSSSALPDTVTFVSLLSACAHSRLVDEGWGLFKMMQDKHGIRPCMEHFACMVNMLGRAGLVDQAYKFVVERMGSEGGPTVWGALLFACSVHGNVEVGEIAADRLLELEPDNIHNYELLLQIYSNAGRQVDAEKVRKMIQDRGLD